MHYPIFRFWWMILLPLLLLTGCRNSVNVLKDQKFETGNWLLVNHNSNDNTLKVIDDEAILRDNPNGVIVFWEEDDAFTTCDGTISLYKMAY